MGRAERVYIRLYKRYAREEDALKCREGERLNGSHQRLKTKKERREGKASFAKPRKKKGGAYSKTCATLHEKRKAPKKYKKDPRASRAVSPFVPIRFSRVHTFAANPTQLGFKV